MAATGSASSTAPRISTISSANALLKVIEEPPPRSLFLIVSHAPQRVLPTIRSRCRRLLLRPLEDGDVRAAIGSLGDAVVRMPGRSARSGDRARRRLGPPDAGDCSTRTRSPSSTRSLKAPGCACPEPTPKQILALAESSGRRDADEDYELALDTVERWVSEQARASGPGLGAARLAPLVEVCEKIARQAREIDVLQSRPPAPHPDAVRRSRRCGSADGVSRRRMQPKDRSSS